MLLLLLLKFLLLLIFLLLLLLFLLLLLKFLLVLLLATELNEGMRPGQKFDIKFNRL